MKHKNPVKIIKLLLAELDIQSKLQLEKILPYKFEAKYAHHITIDWDIEESKFLEIIGQKFSLVVDTIYFDDKIEAIAVDIIGLKIHSVNKDPHITWSGVADIHPYYSNYMLHLAKKNPKTQSIKFKPTKVNFEVNAYYE